MALVRDHFPTSDELFPEGTRKQDEAYASIKNYHLFNDAGVPVGNLINSALCEMELDSWQHDRFADRQAMLAYVRKNYGMDIYLMTGERVTNENVIEVWNESAVAGHTFTMYEWKLEL